MPGMVGSCSWASEAAREKARVRSSDRPHRRRRRKAAKTRSRKFRMKTPERHLPKLVLYDEHPMPWAYLSVFLAVTFAILLLAFGAILAGYEIGGFILVITPALIPLLAIPAAFRVFRGAKEKAIYKQPDPNGVQHWE